MNFKAIQTKLRCNCGQMHTVPINVMVREPGELERENFELRARLQALKRLLRELEEKA